MAGQDDDGEKTVFGGPLPDPADLRDKPAEILKARADAEDPDPFATPIKPTGLAAHDDDVPLPSDQTVSGLPHPDVAPPPISGASVHGDIPADADDLTAPPDHVSEPDVTRPPQMGVPSVSTIPPRTEPDDTRPPQPLPEVEVEDPDPTAPPEFSDSDDTRPPQDWVDPDPTRPPEAISDVQEPLLQTAPPPVQTPPPSVDDDIERTILGAALPLEQDPGSGVSPTSDILDTTEDDDIERTILGAALTIDDNGTAEAPEPQPEPEPVPPPAPVAPAPRPFPVAQPTADPAPVPNVEDDVERTIIGAALPMASEVETDPNPAVQSEPEPASPTAEPDDQRTVIGSMLPPETAPPPAPTPPVPTPEDLERTVIGQVLPSLDPPVPPDLSADQPPPDTNEESTIIGAALPVQDEATILGAALPQVQQPPNAPKAPERRTLDQILQGPIPAPAASANPILAAGSRMLTLLGQLRNGSVDLDLDTLPEQLAHEVENFERNALAAQVDGTEAQIAKYVLCGTADDIIQSLPGVEATTWRRSSLVSRFFRDAGDSGIGVFQEAEKAMQAPRQRFNLLEMFLCCLNLGFEGQYRHMENGNAQVARIRTAIYEALRRVQPRRGADLSATWLPVVPGGKKRSRGMPLWGFFSIAAAVIVAFYASVSYLIHEQGTKVAWAYRTVHPNTFMVQLEREVPGPVFVAKTPDQITRLQDRLVAEIDAGLIRIEEKGDFIILKAGENLRFEPGSASVNSGLVPVSGVLAKALDPEEGPVYVIGHSDAQGSFTKNQLLSQARADAVADVLRATFADPGRLTVLGRGESEPIADNATAEGRSLNRRVEILVARDQSQ